jgi:hypothetical protein
MKFNVYLKNEAARARQSFVSQVNQAVSKSSVGPMEMPDASPVPVQVEADSFVIQDNQLLQLLQDKKVIAAFSPGTWVYIYPAAETENEA